MQYSVTTISSIIKQFLFLVKDPRKGKNCKFPFEFLMICCVISMVFGKLHWNNAALFCKTNLKSLNTIYTDVTKKSAVRCAPSHDTLGRFFNSISLDSYQEAKLFQTITLSPTHVAIDGKCFRGVRKLNKLVECFAVNFYSPSLNFCIAEKYCTMKKGEYNCAVEALKELNLSGMMYTGDAMYCHTEIMQIICDSKSDYCFQLKENQKRTFELSEIMFKMKSFTTAEFEQFDSSRGYSTIYEFSFIEVDDEMRNDEELKKFPNLKTIVREVKYRLHRKTEDLPDGQCRYFLSSSGDVNYIQQVIRDHWLIENRLHRTLDMMFGEDKKLVRTGNGPKNFNLICKLIIHLYHCFAKKNNTTITEAREIISNMTPFQAYKRV